MRDTWGMNKPNSMASGNKPPAPATTPNRPTQPVVKLNDQNPGARPYGYQPVVKLNDQNPAAAIDPQNRKNDPSRYTSLAAPTQTPTQPMAQQPVGTPLPTQTAQPSPVYQQPSIYQQMADQDMAGAQRDRDVSRAAGMREMNEAAISQGIAPGTQRYQAMMRDAQSNVNQFGLDSKNAAASRAQGLMLEEKAEQEALVDNYINSLSGNEKAFYYEQRAQGVDPATALQNLQSSGIEANTALDDELKPLVERYMRFDGMSEQEAMAAAEADLETEFRTENETSQGKVSRAKLVPALEEHLATIESAATLPENNLVGIQNKSPEHNATQGVLQEWSDEQWAAADEAGIVPADNLEMVTGIGSTSTPDAWRANDLQEGEYRNHNGNVYKITKVIYPKGSDGDHKGGQLKVEFMTGPDAGWQGDLIQYRKTGA